MARIVYSGLVTEIKGSVGGTTFQKNRSGYIVRNKQYKGPVKSSENMATGKIFGQCSRMWASLTSTQKSNINTLANTYSFIDPWGVSKTLTGFQWFVACYMLIAVEYPQFLPVDTSINPILPSPVFTVTANSSKLEISTFSWGLGKESEVFFYATPLLRSVTLSSRMTYKRIIRKGSASPLPYNITSLYESVFNVSWSSYYSDNQGYIMVFARTIKLNTIAVSPFSIVIVPVNN